MVEVAVGTDRISPRPDPSTRFSIAKIHISGQIYQRLCLRNPRNICSYRNHNTRLDVSESSCPQVIVDSGAWENGARYLAGGASTGPRTRSRSPNEVTCTHARRTPCPMAKNPWTVGLGVASVVEGAFPTVCNEFPSEHEPWLWLHHMMLRGPNRRDQTTGLL